MKTYQIYENLDSERVVHYTLTTKENAAVLFETGALKNASLRSEFKANNWDMAKKIYNTIMFR